MNEEDVVDVKVPTDLADLLPAALVAEVRKLRNENAGLKEEIRRMQRAVLTDNVLMEIVERRIGEFGYKIDRSDMKRYKLVPVEE